MKNQDKILDYLEFVADKDNKELIDAVIEGKVTILEKYVKNKTLQNFLFDLALTYHNTKSFSYFYSKIPVKDQAGFFLKALNYYYPIYHLEIPLFLLQENKEVFQNQKNIESYEHYVKKEDYFSSESLLERSYLPIKYDNKQQLYAGMIVSHALKVQNINDSNMQVLDYILENRKMLGLKDENIIQYLVENNYELSTKPPIKGLTDKQKVTNVIESFIQYNIDCRSDIQGYLLQLVIFNQFDNIENIILNLVKSGSSIKGLLDRFENNSLHLTYTQYLDLEEIDFNGNRKYDIYKKFDSMNNMMEENIVFIKKLKDYHNLNQKVENKVRKIEKKLKI